MFCAGLCMYVVLLLLPTSLCLTQLHGPGIYSMQASNAKEAVLRFSNHHIYTNTIGHNRYMDWPHFPPVRSRLFGPRVLGHICVHQRHLGKSLFGLTGRFQIRGILLALWSRWWPGPVLADSLGA